MNDIIRWLKISGYVISLVLPVLDAVKGAFSEIKNKIDEIK